MQPTSTVELLRMVQERLTPDTWSHDGPGDGDRLCVLQHVAAVVGGEFGEFDGDVFLVEACDALRYELGEMGLPRLISRFNDDPNTTLEDVHLVLKRAIERLESEGG